MSPTEASVAPPTAPFRILTVCTGNICRSPMAERLLQAGLDDRFPGDFVVESAGTSAVVGKPIDSRVAGFIQELGGSACNFSAKQLTPQIMVRQDLILASTREHRSAIVEMNPASLRKIFTLREFARLLPNLRLEDSLEGASRWSAAVPKALRARTAHPISPEHDDVVDPYRRGEELYQQMFEGIQFAIDRILGSHISAKFH